MSTEYITEPGTEENLRLRMDPHPFDPAQQDMSPPHPALVDGIRALASIGGHGGYSDRSVITFEQDHPELGREFATKYYRFEVPGVVTWGHNGQSFTIEKIIQQQ